MYKLEFAVYDKGRFIGWVDSGQMFEEHWQAVQEAFGLGLEQEGQDFLITESLTPAPFVVVAAAVLAKIRS